MSLISLTKTLANRLRATTYATAVTGHHNTRPKLKGEYVPVYVALGLILVSQSFGVHTAKQQLMHSPTVRVKKLRRVTVPEVTDPDRVVEESENFLSRGFFRRVAEHEVSDSIRKDVYACRPRVETPKSVGVQGPKAA